MSRTRDNDIDGLARRTVVLVDATERLQLVDALCSRARIVDRAELVAGAEAACARRSLAARQEIEVLEREMGSVVASSSADSIHADLVSEQRRTRDAADWSEMQPTEDAEDAAKVAVSAQTIEEHSRAVREANRRLERVLEQRAAVEATLEEARRELGSLGAAHVDETDVRRQMEDASRRLHEVNSEYQEVMSEVARRKATVSEIEAVVAVRDATDVMTDRDQLSAMRAAVNAKFAEKERGGAVVATLDDLAHAHAAAGEFERRAESLAIELAQARRDVGDLENELLARTNDVDTCDERHAAALELESQVTAVEDQLGDAEVRSRDEVDEATRSMSRAELSLERLRQDARSRRRQLLAFASLLPESDRPATGDDPVPHARAIASALRGHADAMQADVDHALECANRDRAVRAVKQVEIDDRRARLDIVAADDRVSALRAAVEQCNLLVIDDAVTIAETGNGILLDDLVRVDAEIPILVLTTDSSVISHVIDLPAGHTVVASVRSLQGFVGTTSRSAAANQSDSPEQSIR